MGFGTPITLSSPSDNLHAIRVFGTRHVSFETTDYAIVTAGSTTTDHHFWILYRDGLELVNAHRVGTTWTGDITNFFDLKIIQRGQFARGVVIYSDTPSGGFRRHWAGGIHISKNANPWQFQSPHLWQIETLGDNDPTPSVGHTATYSDPFRLSDDVFLVSHESAVENHVKVYVITGTGDISHVATADVSFEAGTGREWFPCDRDIETNTEEAYFISAISIVAHSPDFTESKWLQLWKYHNNTMTKVGSTVRLDDVVVQTTSNSPHHGVAVEGGAIYFHRAGNHDAGNTRLVARHIVRVGEEIQVSSPVTVADVHFSLPHTETHEQPFVMASDLGDDQTTPWMAREFVREPASLSPPTLKAKADLDRSFFPDFVGQSSFSWMGDGHGIAAYLEDGVAKARVFDLQDITGISPLRLTSRDDEVQAPRVQGFGNDPTSRQHSERIPGGGNTYA